MKSFLIPLIAFQVLMLTACGMKQKRTKWTDPVMRVMVDPRSVEPGDYVAIQHALHETGKWVVVDRSSAMNAIKKEQEALHRSEPDRFDDKEKFAHWGRLYGVGGVVVGHKRCIRAKGLLGGKYRKCQLRLAIFSSNTAEVVAAASMEVEADDWADEPVWTEVAYAMTKDFPKRFESDQESESLKLYKEESKERAIREKEKQAQPKPQPHSKARQLDPCAYDLYKCPTKSQIRAEQDRMMQYYSDQAELENAYHATKDPSKKEAIKQQLKELIMSNPYDKKMKKQLGWDKPETKLETPSTNTKAKIFQEHYQPAETLAESVDTPNNDVIQEGIANYEKPNSKLPEQKQNEPRGLSEKNRDEFHDGFKADKQPKQKHKGRLAQVDSPSDKDSLPGIGEISNELLKRKFQ